MFEKIPINKFFLAPLAGVNDPAFRLMCEEQGAGLTFTELTSIDYIYSEKQEALRKISRAVNEKRVGLQLFGKHPEKVKTAVELVQDRFEVIDFNVGCPANSITEQGAGAKLLGKPELLKKMLKEIIDNTNKPVTMKYRLGVNRKKENFLEIGKMAEDLGIDMITLHARYIDQGYSGRAYWDRIKMLKEKLNIPVTGNGDVQSPEDAKRMIAETGCDYVMIGRWAMGNPWCFKQTKDFMEKNSYSDVSDKTKINGFLSYVKEAKKYDLPFIRIKNQGMFFTKGVKNGSELRKKIAQAKEEEQIINTMKGFIGK